MLLQDYCAIIITSMTLHNGLTATEGMVAAFGNNEFIRTLYTPWSTRSKPELEEFLQRDSKIEVKIKIIAKGFASAQICVSQDDGNNGLENYLGNLGFKSSDHEDEKTAADLYFKQLEKNYFSSKIKNSQNNQLQYIPTMGKELASAITIGEVGIIGQFGCLSLKGERAPNYLSISSPLHMGDLKIKMTVKFGNIHKKLVYINGKLRVLRMKVDSEISNEPLIMEIIPRLDSTGAYGEMLKESLYIFENSINLPYGYTTSMDTLENIFLGCPRR